MADEKNGENGRNHPRAPIELKVAYKKMNSFFADYTKNISKGGTFIKTNKPLPVGTQFRFKLFVPQQAEPFDLLGRVVWSRDEGGDVGMGIRFIYDSPSQQQDFERVVESLMEKSLGSAVMRKLLDKGKS